MDRDKLVDQLATKDLEEEARFLYQIDPGGDHEADLTRLYHARVKEYGKMSYEDLQAKLNPLRRAAPIIGLWGQTWAPPTPARVRCPVVAPR